MLAAIDKENDCVSKFQANVNVSNNKVENMGNFPIDYYFLTVNTKIKK